MKVKVLQNAPHGAFCNTFDLHLVIIGLEKQFLVFCLSGYLKTGFAVSAKTLMLVSSVVVFMAYAQANYLNLHAQQSSGVCCP